MAKCLICPVIGIAKQIPTSKVSQHSETASHRQHQAARRASIAKPTASASASGSTANIPDAEDPATFEGDLEDQPDPVNNPPQSPPGQPKLFEKPVTYTLGKDVDPYAESLARALQNADTGSSSFNEDDPIACEAEELPSWETEDPFYCGGKLLARLNQPVRLIVQ